MNLKLTWHHGKILQAKSKGADTISIIRFKKVSQVEPEYLIIYSVGPGGTVEIIEGKLISCDSIFIRIVETYNEMQTEISNIKIVAAYHKHTAVLPKY